MAKIKIAKVAPVAAKSKKGGLEVVDIKKVNPTLKELEEYGLAGKYEPNYAPNRYPVCVLEGDVYKTTKRNLEKVQKRYLATFGEELNVDQQVVIVDQLQVQAKAVHFVVGNSKGNYLIKFEYFPVDSNVRFQEKSWFDVELTLMDHQGYTVDSKDSDNS